MAAKNSIQILRGTSSARANHNETSLIGQPLYETDTHQYDTCNASRLFSTGIFFLVDFYHKIHYNIIKTTKRGVVTV